MKYRCSKCMYEFDEDTEGEKFEPNYVKYDGNITFACRSHKSCKYLL